MPKPTNAMADYYKGLAQKKAELELAAVEVQKKAAKEEKKAAKALRTAKVAQRRAALAANRAAKVKAGEVLPDLLAPLDEELVATATAEEMFAQLRPTLAKFPRLAGAVLGEVQKMSVR